MNVSPRTLLTAALALCMLTAAGPAAALMELPSPGPTRLSRRDRRDPRRLRLLLPVRNNDGSASIPVTADTLCPPGTCLVVQGASVRVGGPLDLQARGSLLGLQHVRSSAPMLNAASYMRILEGEFQGIRSAQAGATWLEGGLGLELLQSGSHRHHLLVTAGAAAQSQFSGAQAPWLGGHGVGLPIRVQGVVGSARQALTHLQLEAMCQPVFAWPTSWLERSAGARMGLRIAEVMRHDVALLGEATIVERARMDDPETRWNTQQIGVQVPFEPF